MVSTFVEHGMNAVNISPCFLVPFMQAHDYVNIYTGKITNVGKDHIDYNCNTFTGCSGAIVFLLDLAQPNSVQRCDWGKAVAVHAVYLIRLFYCIARNFGFKIRSHPGLKNLNV
jgi:hypothetical protein